MKIGQPVSLHLVRSRVKTSVYAGQITQINEDRSVNIVYWSPLHGRWDEYTQVFCGKNEPSKAVWWEDTVER